VDNGGVEVCSRLVDVRARLVYGGRLRQVAQDALGFKAIKKSGAPSPGRRWGDGERAGG
jgi:hypothetical protein